MSLFKCKICGGSLEIAAGTTVIECEYCGTQQTLPKLDDEKRANMYDRANHFRRNNEFDKAMGIYENILNEDSTDAEAYWSLVLCRFGVEYVEDPSSHKRVPTVNRTQFTSIFDDNNYKSALQYADISQRALYEEEAKAINEIQKGILAISQKEEPFDVFICYKESDNNGRRTPDSVLAQDLYYQLKQEGFKVFFSRITLEDKLGSAYEPYIFAALNSAMVMVVLGTKPEYFNAVWVKNEWSRYLALIKQGQKKMLIPAYKDMDPYDLPEEFSHLQAQDMSKLGFMQDLIRGIKKIVKSDEPKTTVIKETVVTSAVNSNTAPLLKRAFMFLEDGEWESADEYCEKVLDIDPECAEAYLGKLMVELRIKKQDDLKDCDEPFDGTNNYKKILRFGNEALISALKQYNVTIRERNEENRKADIYNTGADLAKQQTPEKQLKAAKAFERIPGYRDANARAKACRRQVLLLAFCLEIKEILSKFDSATKVAESATTSQQYVQASKMFLAIKNYAPAMDKAEECISKSKEFAEIEYNDPIYVEALNAMKNDDIQSLEEAVKKFQTIIAWKDSEIKIVECNNRIEELKAKAEVKRKDTIYDEARFEMKKEDISKIESAIKKFQSIASWRDSEVKISECNKKIAEINERQEQKRIADEKAKRKKKIIYAITAISAVIFILTFIFVIRPFFSLSTGNYRVYINTYSIENFEIPEGTTRINENAFKDCNTLKSIVIPSSVTYIDEYAFYGCSNLKEIHISDIAAWCSIEYPTGGNGISNPLCYGNLYLNGDLVKELVLPNNVTQIGNYAFYGYDTLSSIIIPDSVKSIGESAFSGCSNLTNVSLSEGLTTINYSAFANCKGLTKIIIPRSVTTISGGDVLDEPFFGCDNLTVYCRAISEPYGWTGKWDVYSHQNYGTEDIKLKVVWGYTGN